jgi:hypothetical protein
MPAKNPIQDSETPDSEYDPGAFDPIFFKNSVPAQSQDKNAA